MPEARVSVDRRLCSDFGDPECPGWQTIQEDSEGLQWFSCELCGFDSGYVLSQDEGTCAAGVPVAAQYIQEPGAGLRERDFTRPKPVVYLGSSIGRRPV